MLLAMAHDLLIPGAGASGLMAAREAALRGLSVALVDAGEKPGRKLAACGGGYANFGNKFMDAGHYLCGAGNEFCKSALAALTQDKMFALLKKWRLPWEERANGRYFLTVPAKKLVLALARECEELGCRFYPGREIDRLEKNASGFSAYAGSEKFSARALLLALGSPAAPALGGRADGFALAKSLGHRISPPAPALAPLLWQNAELARFGSLAGISLPCKLEVLANNEVIAQFVDDFLFTHKGCSGPAILNASLYWRVGQVIRLNFLPGQDFEAMLDAGEKANRTPRSVLHGLLPQKLADVLLPESLARKHIAQISRRDRKALAACVEGYLFTPKGNAGMRAAEICRGGVDCREIDPHTFESRLRENLYIVGEMLDVAGQLGGYNLHWAFSSAYAAARALRAA